MPTYTYTCEDCGKTIDDLRPVDLRDLLPVHWCEKTGHEDAPMARCVSRPAGLHFKGSGFHCNDYPKESR